MDRKIRLGHFHLALQRSVDLFTGGFLFGPPASVGLDNGLVCLYFARLHRDLRPSLDC